MLHIITRISRHLIFWPLLFIALTLSAIRIALFCVDLYKTELEHKLTDLLSAPVKIGQLQAHVRRGLKPELLLKEISIAGTSKQAAPIELQEIRLGIDLLALLKHQQVIPATWITLVGAKFSLIHKADGSFAVFGLQGGNEQPFWLLEGRHYELLQSQMTWVDEKNHRPLYTFKQVDIAIHNNVFKQHHKLNLISQLPAAYGDTLQISADFSGDFFTANRLDANVFLAGKNLNFAKVITADLPLQLKISQGQGDIALWATLKNSQLTGLTGQIQSKELSLQRSDRKKLHFTRFNSRFDWQNLENSWDLALDDLTVAFPKKVYPSAQLRLNSPNKIAQQVAAYIHRLDLDAVQTVADFLLPSLEKDFPQLKKWADFKLKGQLQETKLFADFKQQHYTINGQFQHVSIATPAPYPQLKNISGRITGTQQTGVLTLNSRHADFIAQPMFRSPLHIRKLSGNLNWRQTEQAWILSAANVTMNTPYVDTRNSLNVIIPKNAQPVFMDLHSAFFNANDISHAKVYFPVTLLTSGLLHYLDEAFLKGKVNGDVLFYGNLQDFPFKKHQGVFQVLFDTEDMTMNYADGWPMFEHVNSKVLFENESVEINVKQAQINRPNFAPLQIKSAKISIPSFSTSNYLLVENGTYSGDINAGLDYLTNTPLKLPLKQVNEQLTVKGNTQGELALEIPLVDNLTAKVTGSAQVENAGLTVKALDLPVDNLSGVFRFTEKGFFSDTLTGFGLDYPVQAKVNLTPDATVINVEGRTRIKDLENQFQITPQQIAEGASNYSVQLTLPFSEKQPSQLTVHSELQGVSLNLPDILAKKAADSKALDLKFDLIDGTLLPLAINYSEQLKAQMLIDKKAKHLVGGYLLLGSGTPEIPQLDQFKIRINQPRFSAPLWLAMLDKLSLSSEHSQLLTDLEIHTPQLEWANQSLGNFDLKLKRSPDYWEGSLACVAAKGRLQIPQNLQGQQKIKLAMEQVDLSALMRLDLPKQKTAEAGTLPLFEIDSDKLLLRGVDLGKLKIDTERRGAGVKFSQFTVTAKDRTLSLTGDWQRQNNQSVTRLNGELKAENFGDLLKQLDLNDDLVETNAQIKLDLNWPAAPYQFSLANLSGTLDAKLTGGQISSIEPGFGRLLGVLAMEQWLKRLQLNFDDLYKEGLTFNEITGNFTLVRGKANSQNLKVDAVPATIYLSGEVNLPERTLDQYISVVPKSSSAIPIAGHIVGGIATMMAQTITGEQEEGYYFRSKYRVKGKWDNLTVIPLHEQDGLLKKTWRGLTDFSWITQP